MVFRKHNQTAGFSLIEVLVAITILGLVIVPIGSSLVLSFRLNARSDEVLQAQLAVSSAVETMMAEGFDASSVDEYESTFNVEITNVNTVGAAYQATITAKDIDDVSVTTYFRPYEEDEEDGGDVT